MAFTFLPKPPDRQLVALKEQLYARLTEIKEARADKFTSPTDELHRFENGYDAALGDEIRFLTDLLDTIERS